VLVLADQECLNEEQMASIRNFVNQGGGLVATEHTSLYTPWRQRRRDFGLKDLLKVEAPAWHESEDNEPEELLKVPLVRNQIGKGRAVYVAAVQPSILKPPAQRMTSEYWKLPVNWEELIEAVRWAVGGHLSLQVHAPLTVVAEVTEQRQEGKIMVHLLNYETARTPQVNDIGVSLEMPRGKKVTQVALLSPDEQGVLSPSFSVRDGQIWFTVPRLKTYTVAVIRTQPQ